MSSSTPKPRQRISASARRQQMLDVAIGMARTQGVTSLTLARVAEASGVSKPVAYQHFGSIAGLLREMFEQVGEEYEQTIAKAIACSTYSGAKPLELLRLFCEVYIDCSLGAGALYDELGSILVAIVEEDRSKRVDIAEKYAPFVVAIFGIDERTAYKLMVAFLGAIDRTCEAVISGRIGREEAIDLLMGIFVPAVSVPGYGHD